MSTSYRWPHWKVTNWIINRNYLRNLYCTICTRKCIRYNIPMLLNTLPLQITVKLYTHSQIGFINYTKQLFLNGYTSTCLVENCYVQYVDVLKRNAGFEVFYRFR